MGFTRAQIDGLGDLVGSVREAVSSPPELPVQQSRMVGGGRSGSERP